MPDMQTSELAKKLNGFWSVIFNAGPNFNGGVAVFRDGAIYGGDNAFFYIGTYKIEGQKIVSNVDCRAFAKNAINIFGTQLEQFPLRISGQLETSEQIVATGTVPIAPQLSISLRMTKRAKFE
jgi:hypothetical protein